MQKTKTRRPVAAILVCVDPDIIEYMCSDFAVESPEALLIHLEEMIENGEYSIHELKTLVQDILK